MDDLSNIPAGQFGAQPQIDWSQAEDLKCDECGSVYFRQATQFKRISKFATGSDRDTLYPIQVLRCDDCGHVNEMLKPNLPGQ